jgi:quercetin dioxygenase-like cupin family protein
MRSHDHTAPRSAPVETRGGSMFTGIVWGEVLLPHEAGSGVNRVTFAPRSRTFWHRHQGGQILIGVAGAGLVVTRGGEAALIGESITVHGAAGEEHWHGAGSGSFLTHISIGLSGVTDWLGAVEDADYESAVRSLSGPS